MTQPDFGNTVSGLDQLGKGEKNLSDDILIGVAPVTGCFFMDGGVWMGV